MKAKINEVVLKEKQIRITDCPNMSILIINGIKYSYDFFEAFAEDGIKLNEPFKIIKREDGCLKIDKI